MEFKKIKLPFKIKKPVLALGSQTKNTICFAKDNTAYLSPANQGLSNPRDFSNFNKAVKYFLKKKPKIIAYDLHPEYQSTKYTQSLPPNTYNLLSIQHHHAHIASCMIENGLQDQKVIGVAFDGTGLGLDNALWGAEFFYPCSYKSFKRSAHLKEVTLLGGERAILEPWRLTAAWLYSIYKDKFLNLDISWLKKINRNNWRILKNMYLSGFNSPLVSSMGRLFDAVASLVLEKNKADFEAELAINLERAATGYRLEASGYKFKIIKRKDKYVIDPAPIFKEIISDLKKDESKEKVAYRFHLTIAEMVKRMSLIFRKEGGINKVVLSGGVFQNKLLLSLSLDLLNKEGFKVFTHKALSCNDSGISLGQAIIANFSR
jgi:hydrogenase maturation protein HypF